MVRRIMPMIAIIKVDKTPRGVGTPLIFELALIRGSKLKASNLLRNCSNVYLAIVN